ISCKIWKRLLLTMVAKINLQRLQQSDLDQNREGHAKHEEAQEVSYVRQPVLSFQLQRKPVPGKEHHERLRKCIDRPERDVIDPPEICTERSIDINGGNGAPRAPEIDQDNRDRSGQVVI